MTTVSVRLPESLHLAAKDLAKLDGISMNQLITSALAEKLAAIGTEKYLEERAARGSREKFLAAMSKVADVDPPDPADRLE